MLILTAIPVEAKCILSHLVDVVTVRGDRGTLYECGVFKDPTGDWFVTLAITSAGNQPAASILQGAARDFDEIDIVLFVGIAGSLKSDVVVGSVVTSSQVYNVHSGKAAQDMMARPRVVTPEFSLVQIATKVALDGEWCGRIIDPKGMKLPASDKYPCPFPPDAHVAPVASGEQVVVNEKSNIFRDVRRHFNDAYVIEMEGYGALYASQFEQLPALIVRGVSDMAGGDKTPEADIHRQPVAAAHAAAFAFQLLATMSVLEGPRLTPHGPDSPSFPPITSPDVSPSRNGDGNSGLMQDSELVVITLQGETGDFDQARLARVIGSLRKITGDEGIRLVRVESGSVRLVVEMSPATLRKLESGLVADLETREDVKVVGVAPLNALTAATQLIDDFRRASADVLAWPRLLPGGEWIERPEVAQLRERINCTASSASVVLGAPGSGKSAIMAQLSHLLVERGVPTLAIKADLLPTSVEHAGSLQNFLGLPVDASYAIELVARCGPVVLIIDQLDALANYIDLRTGRLNTILNLVRRLSEVQNVHLIISSRRFEFEHDARLRAIEADQINLELPPWHAVSSILAKHGVEADSWAEHSREVLRSPQALRIFLSLLKGAGVEPVLPTYQTMLDRLWQERVLSGLGGPRRARLAEAMAKVMADKETLWLAAAQFDEWQDDVRSLEASGVLVRSESGSLIGFSHQTIFEHVLARAFVKESGGLSSYVLERQDSLFVRPKVWAGLTYLRGVNPSSYFSELTSIWRSEIRNHLRQLLIEFLGQQVDPSDLEETLVLPLINDETTRATALRAVAGSRGWFGRLRSRVLPLLMTDPNVAPSIVLPVLVGARAFASEQVFELLEAHWAKDASKDMFAWHVLEQGAEWSQAATRLAERILRRTAISGLFVDQLASRIVESDPVQAFLLVRARLDRELDQVVQSESKRVSPPFPDNGAVEEQIAWSMKHDSRVAYENLLDKGSDWFELPELARAYPNEFIEVLWPWYRRVLALETDYGTPELEYLGSRSVRFRFDNLTDTNRYPLIAAIYDSVTELAKTDPEAFRIWLEAAQTINSQPIQRLIAAGLLADVSNYSDDIVHFLLEDPKRLTLGDFSNAVGTSAKLLREAMPKVDKAAINSLEKAVVSIGARVDFSSVPLERRRVLQDAIDSYRSRLLQVFPAEYLTGAAEQILAKKNQSTDRVSDTDADPVQVRYIGSPMSRDRMNAAPDEEIIELFEQLDDRTGWDHPTIWGRGGSIPLSREFAEFASHNEERAYQIIKQLPPVRNERPVAYALESMASGTNAEERLLQLILELDSRGFGTDEYKQTVARAIGRLAQRDAVITDEIVALLERWLASSETSASLSGNQDYEDGETLDTAVTDTAAEEPKNHRGSVLWGGSRIGILPGGTYPLLDALAHVLLRRGTDGRNRLRHIITKHILRRDSQKVWEAFLHFFVYLGDEPQQSNQIIRRLLDEYPSLIESAEFAILLAQTHWWLEPKFIQDALARIAQAENEEVRQAAGEVLGLIAIVRPSEEWAQQWVSEILGEPTTTRYQTSERAGLAYAAANLWSDRKFRDRSTDVLTGLISNGDESLGYAVVDVFRLADELQPDGPTVRLLEAFSSNPRLARFADDFLVEGLQTLLPNEADLIGRIATNIARENVGHLSDIRTSMASVGPGLVNIAVTLHRMGGNVRELGLSLFETLLDNDVLGAKETLDQIDNRLRPARPFLRRPRRRRSA